MTQTFVPGRPFTMSDEDAERFMRTPRTDSRIQQALSPQPTTRYVMTGSCSASSRPNRKRKFKR
ncbi:hypothetical protein M0Q28_04255 [Patescibacteria group bacterium]|jgi:hypothetical protein|nr:hypothetical protein [Patescibacteria group bacterium]